MAEQVSDCCNLYLWLQQSDTDLGNVDHRTQSNVKRQSAMEGGELDEASGAPLGEQVCSAGRFHTFAPLLLSQR